MKLNIEKLKPTGLLISILKSMSKVKGVKTAKINSESLISFKSLLDISNPFELNLEYDSIGTEGIKIKDSFTYSVLGYNDYYELGIFKVKTTNSECKINENYFTGFCIELQGKVILQRIIKNKDAVVSSELIAFNPITGNLKEYGELGNYEIYDYDSTKRLLTGGNNSERVNVRL